MKIFLKKSQKTSYLENCKILSSPIQRQDSQSPEITLTYSNNRTDLPSFGIFQHFSFFENFEENNKKRDISKIRRI